MLGITLLVKMVRNKEEDREEALLRHILDVGLTVM